MKAISLKIHNFRSILDAEINLLEFGLLVGTNNSGKTTVVDCIRIFYEKNIKFNSQSDFPKGRTSDKESWAEIEFKPSADELTTLKDDYKSPQGTFRIRKYFLTTEKGADGKEKSGLYAYINGQLSDDRFYGFKNVGQGKFGDVIYIPAVSKVDEHTKLTGPSALRDLVTKVLTKVIEHSSAYKKLKDSFENFEKVIKTEKTDDGFSLKSIEEDVSANISDWGTEFRLSVNAVGIDDLVKSLIGHDIFDKALGESQAPTSYGQGFQRSLIYTLIRVAAKYATAVPANKPKEFLPELTWILFEEPEAFLHPTQIAVLSSDLRLLAKTDFTQVLLTTHSSHFATHSISDIPAICRMHKSGCVSNAYQIAESQLNQVLASNQTDIPTWIKAGISVNCDDLKTDMESIKYALWLDEKRASSLFSEKVLLVEGPTETALLTYLFDIGKLNCCRGVYIMDTIGKFNIHRFMTLFGHLGIRHYVLHDGDNGKYSATVDRTISNSKNRFTGGVDTFIKDIEDFLGIAPAGLTHRKPQHVMHSVISGSVTEVAINKLAAKIESLLSK